MFSLPQDFISCRKIVFLDAIDLFSWRNFFFSVQEFFSCGMKHFLAGKKNLRKGKKMSVPTRKKS